MRYKGTIQVTGNCTWLQELYNLNILPTYAWDTRWMHHALDPKDEHSLAYLASIYTARPYWKSMCKDPNPYSIYTYNGIDAAVTLEVFHKLHDELLTKGRLYFYQHHYSNLFTPLFELQRHGIRVDGDRRVQLANDCKAKAAEAATKLNELTGESIIAKVAVSHQKLQAYLYNKMKLPKRMKDKHVTTDEAALIALRTSHCEKKPVAAEVIDLVLEHRRATKLYTTFLTDSITDKDGRARCEYTFTPVTGRLSSSSNPMGTGLNLQNVDNEVKDIFLPDPNCVLLEVDLSQAEWRIMAMLTRDDTLIKLAGTPPTEFDVHRYNASIVFSCSEQEVNKDMRYISKRAVHAADYGMHAKKLAEILLKDGHVKSPKECERIIETYMTAMPAIRRWQHETAEQVRIHRCLANGWGRMIHFAADRITDDTYREAYAWRPQSECADLLNHYGLLPLYDELVHYPGASMNLQIHDALYVSCQPEQAFPIAEFLSHTLSRPRVYYGRELRMPCTFALKRNCKDGVEFKALPSMHEFTEAARSMLP